jgi:hypothetical protein
MRYLSTVYQTAATCHQQRGTSSDL